jgi:RNA polymerase sigma-70 factor, ECF subfamily
MAARQDAAMDGAIEALYRRRFHVYVHVAFAITGEAESARDAVQEAFALALRRQKSLRKQQSLESWVWRIVVTRSIEAARRGARERRLTALGPTMPEPGAERSNGHDGDVVRAVRALPERQRLALFLRYYADLDYYAIGEVLDVAEGTVAASLHAAHKALKARLKTRGA